MIVCYIIGIFIFATIVGKLQHFNTNVLLNPFKPCFISIPPEKLENQTFSGFSKMLFKNALTNLS